jgi:hypothetical protein
MEADVTEILGPKDKHNPIGRPSSAGMSGGR